MGIDEKLKICKIFKGDSHFDRSKNYGEGVPAFFIWEAERSYVFGIQSETDEMIPKDIKHEGIDSGMFKALYSTFVLHLHDSDDKFADVLDKYRNIQD